MKPSSFRVHIVLWSVLISGAVLLCFGLVAWWSLNRDRLDELDDSITAFGFRHGTRISRNADRDRLELSLIEQIGEEKARTRFFALLSNNGEIFRSGRTPEGIDFATLPAGTELMDPQPYVPKPPPKPGSLKLHNPPAKDRRVMYPQYYTVSSGGEDYRIGVFANREVTFIVGADLVELSGEVDAMKRAFLLALPGALLLVALGAWLISRRALSPIHAMRRDMKRISAQELDSRLEVQGADAEFAAIIEQYNAMLERLERSFHQATRFSADASHELKTPLAVMRGTLERALANAPDRESQAIHSDLLEQTDRQKAILESLLLLSRADSGHLKISDESIDLSQQLTTWLEDASFLAEERNISIKSDISPGALVKGDPSLLQQVAHNLFSNAVRHNEDGGIIHCRLKTSGDSILWEVSNSGPQIPEEELESIFERFQRGSTTQGSGTGLGLSLVKEIVVAHHGTISVESDTNGTIFRILLQNISSV